MYGEIEKAGGFSEAAGQIGYPGISRGIFYEMGFSTWKPIPELIRRFKGRSPPSGPKDLGCPGQPKLSECVRAAQEALKRLSSAKTRHDWMVVGKGLQDLRAEAMRTAHVNKPTGRRYSQEFSALLKASDLDGINKATRSRLLAVLDHITEIESWLATLPANKKLDLNHPHTIWRAYQKTVAKKPQAGTKPSYVAELKASIVALEGRVGWVPVPVFAVVGRALRDSAAKPDTSITADLNDEIPAALR